MGKYIKSVLKLCIALYLKSKCATMTWRWYFTFAQQTIGDQKALIIIYFKFQIIRINSCILCIISWGLLNCNDKPIVSLWTLLQHIFAETKEQFLCSWSFACWRSQKQDQREDSASFPGLPLVQRQGNREELRSRKANYWKVGKCQELKTGQQVFTLCSLGWLLEEFLCSLSCLICSNCASGSWSAAHLITGFSVKRWGWQGSALLSVPVLGCCQAIAWSRAWWPVIFSYTKITFNVSEFKASLGNRYQGIDIHVIGSLYQPYSLIYLFIYLHCFLFPSSLNIWHWKV